ncbi:MAG: hypothetical protein IJ523_06800 [Succinivibrionaceae bacterium]|nr:hypothetical protein [Succinivibrionaceae bacterium]
MASKLIEAAALRSKVHKMIERSEHDHVTTEWDKGFRYALARVESLIDKMPEAQRMEFNMVQNGTGTVIGEVHGDLTISRRENRTVTFHQEAKEIHNIDYVETMKV